MPKTEGALLGRNSSEPPTLAVESHWGWSLLLPSGSSLAGTLAVTVPWEVLPCPLSPLAISEIGVGECGLLAGRMNLGLCKLSCGFRGDMIPYKGQRPLSGLFASVRSPCQSPHPIPSGLCCEALAHMDLGGQRHPYWLLTVGLCSFGPAAAPRCGRARGCSSDAVSCALELTFTHLPRRPVSGCCLFFSTFAYKTYKWSWPEPISFLNCLANSCTEPPAHVLFLSNTFT